MTQISDLNNIGLIEMSELDMKNVDGGYSWYQFGHAVGQYILAMSILIAQ